MSTRRAPLLAALALAPLLARPADVWVAGSTEKIRPDAKPRASAGASLEAAKNEFEAFQVVVTGRATQVSVEASPLSGAAGEISDVKAYREDLIDLAQPSALDGGTGRWPDALVPDVDDVVGEKRNAFPFDVNDGESRAIWVEYHVPAGARSGIYEGSVKVRSAEGEAVVPVKLAVWDFELPSTASLRTHFGLQYNDLQGAHGVGGDDNAALRARYAQLGLDHRISVSGMADDGQQGDFGHFDRFYEPLVDGTAPTRLAGAKLTTVKYIGDPMDVGAQRAWAEHARQRGWMDRLFQYTCDEPELTCKWSQIGERAAAARQADPELKTLVTTSIQEADGHGVTGDIDIMVPVVNYMDNKDGQAYAGDQRPAYDGFLSGAGKELWLYQSCMSHGCGGTVDMGSPNEWDQVSTGWPSYMIDSSAARNRAMEWISFIEKASGELYWDSAYAFTQRDAWWSQWDFSGNGDGTLFYPGTTARIGGQTDIPVASIRLKMVREGMEDYEYLKALSDAGDPALAREIAKGLFPSASQTDVDPAKLMAARQQIAARILELTGKKEPSLAEATASAAAAAAGCESARGSGALALLAFPAVVLLAGVRRRRARA